MVPTAPVCILILDSHLSSKGFSVVSAGVDNSIFPSHLTWINIDSQLAVILDFIVRFFQGFIIY